MQRRLWKRMAAVVITISILSGLTPYQTYATQSTRDKISEAEKESKRLEDEVGDAQKEVDGLNSRKDSLKKELNNLNAEMESIVERINDLETKISEKEQEISVTKDELEQARNKEAQQYEAMKKRIQFMYEDSRSLYLEIVFKAESFSDFITLSNYVDSLADYDKKKLDEYEAVRISIEELEARLETEKADLDVLKAEAETEKANIMVVIDKTSDNISEYNDLIDDAEAELLKKEEKLKAQQETVEALKKQLEEELRLSALAAQSAWRDISQVTFDSGDRYLLAVLIYCEAGGEPYEGQVAVGAVVINRVLSSVYPNTVSGVIYQDWQFSPVKSGRFGYYLSIGKTTQSCYNAADAAMSGITNVGNCLHFRTPIPGLTGIQIGGHIFY